MVNKIRVLIGFVVLFPQLIMFLVVKLGGVRRLMTSTVGNK